MSGVKRDTCDEHGPPSRTRWACLLLAASGFAVCAAGMPEPIAAQRPAARRSSVRPASGEELPDEFAPEFERQPWEQPESAFEPNEELVDVRIEGNVTIPAASIARLVKTRSGRVPSPQQVKDDVRALYGTRWFFQVEPIYSRSDKGLVLIFRVQERPILRSVAYKGNKKIKTKNLEALTGLKAGGAFNVLVNNEAVRRIEQHYEEKGYSFAKVTLESGNAETDRDVIFVIEEGEKSHVYSVKLEGNKYFSDGLLKTKLRTSTRKFWLFGGKYDPDSPADDIAALKEYYHSLGFFDVQIQHKKTFSDDKSVVRFEYDIVEGQQYKVRNVEIAGNQVLSEEAIRAKFKLRGNENFNAMKLNKDVESIREQYGELGRIFAKVDAVPRFLETPGEVDLVYNIDEDQVYRIRRVEVMINGDHPHTKESVVINRLTFAPGDLASAKEIQRSTTRLKSSGYFSTNPMDGTAPKIDIRRVEEPVYALTDPRVGAVRAQNYPRGDERPTGRSGSGQEPLPQGTPPQNYPKLNNLRGKERASTTARSRETVFRAQNYTGAPPPASNPVFNNDPQGDPFGNALRDPPPPFLEQPPGLIDVFPSVTETQTGRLMFGVGVNSDAGVVGSIVLDEGNFDLLRFPTSYTDFLNGTAFRGGGQQFRAEAVPGDQVSRYLVSWRDPYFLDSNYSLGVSGFYYTRFFEDWNETRGGGRVTVGRQFSPFLSSSITLRAEDVELNNIATPAPAILTESAGNNFLSTARFSVVHDTRDSGFLATEGHFIELAYEQAFGEYSYPRFDIEGRQYFTTYQRPDGGGRHIVSLKGQVSYTGSDTPIFERLYAGGFQSFRGFRFRGVTPVELGVGIGGEFMTLGSAEYMFPLTADESLRFVTFTDFGTVEDSVTLDNFRATAGAGLRITIPAMGPAPIALDFAWPLVKQDFDRERVFSFYVGFLR